jgi:hypothetical protein
METDYARYVAAFQEPGDYMICLKGTFCIGALKFWIFLLQEASIDY